MKESISILKKAVEQLEALADKSKLKNQHPLEHKDLEEALTLLKSVKRRLKAKERDD